MPVTAINVANWVVTKIRTTERDGYEAIQMGHLRDRYSDAQFVPEWLTNSRKFFSALREVRLNAKIEVLIG